MVERTVKILLVEDNPGDARLIQEVLAEAGSFRFDLHRVERLSEALTRLAAESYDVVLLDLSLPDSAGLDTLSRTAAAVQRGAADYLVKGQVDGGVLARSIRYAIERKRGEERLRQSEERFRKLAEATFEGICITEGGTIVEVNPSFAAMFGYPPAELLGMSPVDLVTAESRETVRRNLLSSSEKPYEATARRANGTTLPIEVIGRDLSYGERTARVAAIRDLTDRKQAEEERLRAVREQSARAEAEAAQRWAVFLAETSAVLTSSLDYEETLAQVAQLAVPYLADGCAVYLIEGGDSPRRIALVHADPAKADLIDALRQRYPARSGPTGPLSEVLATGRSLLLPTLSDTFLERWAEDAEHLRILRALDLRSAIFVPLIARERTLGAMAFSTAQSGHTYTPRDLGRMEELAYRVALALDNARLYREAREAVRTRNELFSAVSHDLKNPLGGIKAVAQLLRRRLSRLELPEGERIHDNLMTIDSLTGKMTKLIDELLDLARLQMGASLDLERLPTDLVALTRQMVEEQQRATQQHRIVVAAAVPAAIGAWDADRLERVLANLLNNAVKYSPKGGEITVTIDRETDPQGDWAVLRVEDQGLGIPAEDLPRVFERFYRARNVAEHFRGAGIGLAGVRQTVEQHGGSITVASQEAAGTTFTVRLPLSPTPAATLG